MEEIKYVVSDGFEFEVGHNLNLLATFGIFGLSKIRAIGEK